MTVANRVRRLRVEEAGLSQAGLARQIDVSRQTLHAIERGQRLPSLEVAHRIADALGVDLDSVFHYEPSIPSEDGGDDRLIVSIRFEDGTPWWEAEDVCRVTTSAKRCSDAARIPHNHAP